MSDTPQDNYKTLEFGEAGEDISPTASGLNEGWICPCMDKLFAALAKARTEFKPVVFDKVNPYFNSKFASLHTMQAATVEALSKNGLAIMQMPLEIRGGGLAVKTWMTHASGQWVENVLPMRPTKDDPQGVGSAITYACRYSYAAMLNIAGADDDDGNSASVEVKKISAATAEEFASRIIALGDTPAKGQAQIARFNKKYGLGVIADLPADKETEANLLIQKKELGA